MTRLSQVGSWPDSGASPPLFTQDPLERCNVTTRPEGPYPYLVDISASLPTNDNCPPPLQNGWYKRHDSEITGITIHHTLSYSPWETAAYYITKGGGRPSIPYHYWICACGSAFRCLALDFGCWHDHTGHRNKNVSMGMAGKLHIHRPPDPQLASTAAIIASLLRGLHIDPDQIRGHNDRSEPHGFPTACPGWDHWRTGHWRRDLIGKIAAELTHSPGGPS